MNSDEWTRRLKAYGADVPGIMERFMDDMDLYASCYQMFLEDGDMAKLDQAMKAQDYKAAFETAHALKGVTGNLGLTPLYRAVCALVEILRSATYDALPERYEELLRQEQILAESMA